MVDMNVDAFDEAETELKFIATTDNGDVLWETGYNRTLAIPEMANGEVRVEEMDQAFFEICDRKLAGTLIPVFSLRTRGSFGVGDFGDLKMMIDWVVKHTRRCFRCCPSTIPPLPIPGPIVSLFVHQHLCHSSSVCRLAPVACRGRQREGCRL